MAHAFFFFKAMDSSLAAKGGAHAEHSTVLQNPFHSINHTFKYINKEIK